MANPAGGNGRQRRSSLPERSVGFRRTHLAFASWCGSSGRSTRSVTVSVKTNLVPTAERMPSTVVFSHKPLPTVALVATTRSPILTITVRVTTM